MDLIGLLTKTFLAITPAAAPATAPARPAIVSAPLVGAPGAAAASPAVAPTAAPASASDVVDRVQAFYAGISGVEAMFRQTVTYATFGTSKSSDGTLILQKPGKMRWDYVKKKGAETKRNKSFISNGSYLYVVEMDNKQVIKKNLQNDLMPVAVSFLYGKGDLKSEFSAELDKSGKYGAAQELVLKLTPKKPSAQYKNLYLVVNPENFRVTQSIIIDSSDNVNHFRFYAPNFKATPKASTFEFDEAAARKKGFRVVDGDAQQQGSGAGTNMMP